jgi:hypothetical protein
MPLDPSIFMQGAQLRQNYDKMQRDQTQNAIDSMIKMKAANKEDAGSLVKLAEAAAYKKASGLELTPEEDALAQGWDKIESSKVSLDPLGRPYSPRSRLFEGMAEMAPPKYNSAYAAPVSDSPFPADFVNGDMSNTANAGEFNVAQIDSMLPEHLQGIDRTGQNINQAGPIMDQNFGAPMAPRSVADGLQGRLPSDNTSVLQADIEAQKAIMVDDAKARNESNLKSQETQQENTKLLTDLKKSIVTARQALNEVPKSQLGPLGSRYASMTNKPEFANFRGAQNTIALQAKTLLGLPSANFSDADRDFLTEIAGGKYGEREGFSKALTRLEKLANDQMGTPTSTVDLKAKYGLE